MMRGRIKEIIITSRIDRSPGKRMCHANRQEHVIPRGSYFLAIKDGLSEKSYCLSCAQKILENGQRKINYLIIELEKAISES